MFTITTSAALWSGAIFIVSGVAFLGILKVALLDGMLKVIQALEAQIKVLKAEVDAMKTENKAVRTEMSRMKADGELKGRQLTVSLRVIEYFERVITVVIKGRPRMPKDLSSAIDDGLRELAEFRQQATLDLESMHVNRDHYDWLLAREAIMGPDRSLMEPDPAPGEGTATISQTRKEKTHEL